MEGDKEKRQIYVVIALIENDKGEILFQKRVDPMIPDADGKWEFPGGRVEYGESPEDTVRRETIEEIGCEIELISMLPLVQSNIWGRADKKEQHVLVSCYKARLISGIPISTDKKVSRVCWFAKDKIDQLDMLESVRNFINFYNKSKE
ncbi:MAG: NUDIX domain-containing protein [bacterium]|nr:NUDIX domain-containing protein [bacterium]